MSVWCTLHCIHKAKQKYLFGDIDMVQSLQILSNHHLRKTMNTKMTLQLTKEELESILFEVIDPFYHEISNDPKVKDYIHSSEALMVLKHKQVLLAYRFFSSSSAVLDKHITFAAKAHEKIGLPSDILYAYALKMTKLYEKWLCNHRTFDKASCNLWNEKLKEFLSLMMHDYEEKKSDEDIFFDITQEQRDEKVDSMHYSDEEKIDAQTFMAQDSIHEGEIDDLKELMLDLKDSIEDMHDFEKSFVDDFSMLLVKISKFFRQSGEFKDLSYPMDNLYALLERLELDALSDAHKKLLFEFLKSIYSDLDNWMGEVLIDKRAKDIHYLDASLLANISQIEIMLQDSQEAEDEDFMF